MRRDNSELVKERLLSFCADYVQKRIRVLQNNLQDLRDSLDSEDKSTAGDKHETGRAMIQLERESLGERLAEVERMGQVLDRVKVKSGNKAIGLGSLVRTSKHNYFIAISAGLYEDSNECIYCISAATPIAGLLLGKSVDDTFYFNNEEIKIEGIL